jgi:glucose/arabinose dehydrogenase
LPGFHIGIYAEGGLQRPRKLALAPNGDVFLADSGAGIVYVLRGLDERGRARERFTFATGLRLPFGLAFSPGWLYVGDTDAVVRFAYESGDVQARGAPERIAELPGRGYHEHWTRALLFSRDFAKLYVTIGSSTNDLAEKDPERASVLEMNADGSSRRIFASGARNPLGLARRPGTNELWAAVQERDGFGDDLVPDFVTRLVDGAFYGWPYAYLGPHEDPSHASERPDLVAKTRAPELLIAAHSAVMDLVFYDGAMFPAAFRGDLILSFHGSWNRSRRIGYSLARARFHGGEPDGGYDDFVVGWSPSPEEKEVWGRPVGLLVLGDGSLLVADDGGNVVWRVTYY